MEKLSSLLKDVAELYEFPGAIICLFDAETGEAKVSCFGMDAAEARQALAIASFYNEQESIEGDKVKMTPPLEIVEAPNYPLAIKDGTGKTHYFVEGGRYDGWSQDPSG